MSTWPAYYSPGVSRAAFAVLNDISVIGHTTLLFIGNTKVVLSDWCNVSPGNLPAVTALETTPMFCKGKRVQQSLIQISLKHITNKPFLH